MKKKRIEDEIKWCLLIGVIMGFAIGFIIMVGGVGVLIFEMNKNTLEAVNDKCYVVNKVTIKYWDIANNIFVGGHSYIENSTEINCKEII